MQSDVVIDAWFDKTTTECIQRDIIYELAAIDNVAQVKNSCYIVLLEIWKKHLIVEPTKVILEHDCVIARAKSVCQSKGQLLPFTDSPLSS